MFFLTFVSIQRFMGVHAKFLERLKEKKYLTPDEVEPKNMLNRKKRKSKAKTESINLISNITLLEAR